MTKNKSSALIILDGWGIRNSIDFNAIRTAQPHTFNLLWEHNPHASLNASGVAVGLPEKTMGNSEVGHLTIGAGSIIKQPLSRINDLIFDGKLCSNNSLIEQLTSLKKTKGALHLIGLVSDGGVHSHLSHLCALIKCAAEYSLKKIFIHAILDGRDTPPQSAHQFLSELEMFCKTNQIGTIASICGRFYAMDRDEQWDRVEQAFHLYTDQNHKTASSWQTALEESYENSISDEFVSPIRIDPEGYIKKNDGVIFFNFRPDRMRELVSYFLATKIPTKRGNYPSNFPIRSTSLFILSMVAYHPLFTNSTILPSSIVSKTLLDEIEKDGRTIFTIAETEKYAHVTYFLNGGREVVRTGETRILVPSKGLKNYADYPCMSANEITAAILTSLEKKPADFYVANYANVDMVGHTGDFNATIDAVTCVDKQIAELYDAFVLKRGGMLFIVGDHGNGEEMWDQKTDRTKTSHTTNPVPFIAVNSTLSTDEMHGLADIKNYILLAIGITRSKS